MTTLTAPSIVTKLPGPKAKALIEKDERFVSQHFKKDYPLVVEEASGMVVTDPDGNRFLDFAAGIAVCATGHCHPRVVAAILSARARALRRASSASCRAFSRTHSTYFVADRNSLLVRWACWR